MINDQKQLWKIEKKKDIFKKTKMSKEDILDQLGVILWITIVFGIPIVLSLIL